MTDHLKNANELTAADDALLPARAVRALAGISRSTLSGLIANHGFPQPMRFSQRCHRWRAGDVKAWIRSRSSAAT